MSQPPIFGDFGVQRDELEAVMRRQNEVAIRAMAMENVMRELGVWLAQSLPSARREAFFDSLAALPEMSFGSAVPAGTADGLKALVAKEQRHMVDLIRAQHRLAEK